MYFPLNNYVIRKTQDSLCQSIARELQVHLHGYVMHDSLRVVVGTLITQSGAADALGNLLSSANIQNQLFLILVVILLTIVLLDLTSNTGTAAAVPIVLNLAIAMGLNPIPYLLVARCWRELILLYANINSCTTSRIWITAKLYV